MRRLSMLVFLVLVLGLTATAVNCSSKKKTSDIFIPTTNTNTDTAIIVPTNTGTNTFTMTNTNTGTDTNTNTGTVTGPGFPPGMAGSPNPADGATGIGTTQTCSWGTVADADSYNVYFGTTSPPPSQINQSITTFNPGVLATDTTYFWRIDTVNIYGTTSGSEWYFVTGHLPGVAQNPDPGNGDTGVNTNVSCSWDTVTDATSYNVSFGATSPPPFIQNQTGNIYDPGTLSTDATYYWRIDTVNSVGNTSGTEWYFVTSAAPSAPARASNPDPPDGTQNCPLDQQLSWATASGADYYEIYFGTPTVSYMGCQAGTTFDPGALTEGTSYYWRIDTVNTIGTTPGFLWEFSTGSAPAKAQDPDPADTATDIPLVQQLSWGTVSDATTYNVYFGTVDPPVTSVSNTTDTSYNPAGLNEGTTYYWRVDTVNEFGTTTGDDWSFTTIPPKTYTLEVAAGPLNTTDEVLGAIGQDNNFVFHLQLYFDGEVTEYIYIYSLSLTLTNSGDPTHIDFMKIWYDDENDGLTTGDSVVGTAVPDALGNAFFADVGSGFGFYVGSDTTYYWIVKADIGTNAVADESFTFSFADASHMNACVASTVTPAVVTGAPVNGATLTVEASASVKLLVSIGPECPAGGTGTIGNFSGMAYLRAAQFELEAIGAPMNVNTIANLDIGTGPISMFTSAGYSIHQDVVNGGYWDAGDIDLAGTFCYTPGADRLVSFPLTAPINIQVGTPVKILILYWIYYDNIPTTYSTYQASLPLTNINAIRTDTLASVVVENPSSQDPVPANVYNLRRNP
ncbi:MAG: fibronectin type III domain-containing protein [Planctomycetota bacterium]|jgi:hypothetical protein